MIRVPTGDGGANTFPQCLPYIFDVLPSLVELPGSMRRQLLASSAGEVELGSVCSSCNFAIPSPFQLRSCVADIGVTRPSLGFEWHLSQSCFLSLSSRAFLLVTADVEG